jgi:hypothetical protein
MSSNHYAAFSKVSLSLGTLKVIPSLQVACFDAVASVAAAAAVAA